MKNYRIDNLQYCNWSKEIFQINNEAKLDAVHVTIAYHEDFNEVKKNVEAWNKHFQDYKNLIFHGKTFKDIEKAHQEKKTAIFFGFQNCSPIEDDISLVEKVYDLGARFMQLTYNNQSLLATGCYEKKDSGITRMGKEVIKEMNRMGIVVDMSHSAEQSTLDAIELSSKPIAITHANPSFWFAAKRNKSLSLLSTPLLFVTLVTILATISFDNFIILYSYSSCLLSSFTKILSSCLLFELLFITKHFIPPSIYSNKYTIVYLYK